MPRRGTQTYRWTPDETARRIRERKPEMRAFILNNIAHAAHGYTSQCWVWQRYTGDQGYGRADIGGVGRVNIHRLSYEVFVGAIPDGLTIDHLCRNRACCNPDHLEPVTSEENSRRASRSTATHCAGGHERSPGSAYSNGACKRCQATYQKRWEAANPGYRRAKRLSVAGVSA